MKGHRSVGGMRASIYNAFPQEGITALVGAMREFEAANAEYARHFAPGRLPARTTVGVTALALGGAVEIDLIVRL